jgi:hypothetical protein
VSQLTLSILRFSSVRGVLSFPTRPRGVGDDRGNLTPFL